MNQLNSLIIEGNLVRDPELSEPTAGFKVCKFSIAVNRFYKNKKDEAVEEVSYFDVEAYGKSAEYCKDKGRKGRGIRVVGRLKQDHWKDEDGKMKSKVFVIAEHLEYKPEFKSTMETPADGKQKVYKTAEVPVEVPAEAVMF